MKRLGILVQEHRTKHFISDRSLSGRRSGKGILARPSHFFPSFESLLRMHAILIVTSSNPYIISCRPVIYGETS